jgi:hypothetical protein
MVVVLLFGRACAAVPISTPVVTRPTVRAAAMILFRIFNARLSFSRVNALDTHSDLFLSRDPFAWQALRSDWSSKIGLRARIEKHQNIDSIG